MKVLHICPETGNSAIVSAKWDGDDYVPVCGRCDGD